MLDVYRDILTYHVRADGAVKIPTIQEEIPQLKRGHSAIKYTDKLMTIAMETLRLDDPSTLFETHALEIFRRVKLCEPNRAHIVLAVVGMIDQVCTKLRCCALTDDRVNPAGSNGETVS